MPGYIRGGEEGGLARTPPPPWVPLWSPSKAGQKFLSFNPLGTEGTEAKLWLSASNIGRGGGGGPGGGGIPPPPTVYGPSNTSLGTRYLPLVCNAGRSAVAIQANGPGDCHIMCRMVEGMRHCMDRGVAALSIFPAPPSKTVFGSSSGAVRLGETPGKPL